MSTSAENLDSNKKLLKLQLGDSPLPPCKKFKPNETEFIPKVIANETSEKNSFAISRNLESNCNASKINSGKEANISVQNQCKPSNISETNSSTKISCNTPKKNGDGNHKEINYPARDSCEETSKKVDSGEKEADFSVYDQCKPLKINEINSSTKHSTSKKNEDSEKEIKYSTKDSCEEAFKIDESSKKEANFSIQIQSKLSNIKETNSLTKSSCDTPKNNGDSEKIKCSIKDSCEVVKIDESSEKVANFSVQGQCKTSKINETNSLTKISCDTPKKNEDSANEIKYSTKDSCKEALKIDEISKKETDFSVQDRCKLSNIKETNFSSKISCDTPKKNGDMEKTIKCSTKDSCEVVKIDESSEKESNFSVQDQYKTSKINETNSSTKISCNTPESNRNGKRKINHSTKYSSCEETFKRSKNNKNETHFSTKNNCHALKINKTSVEKEINFTAQSSSETSEISEISRKVKKNSVQSHCNSDKEVIEKKLNVLAEDCSITSKINEIRETEINSSAQQDSFEREINETVKKDKVTSTMNEFSETETKFFGFSQSKCDVARINETSRNECSLLGANCEDSSGKEIRENVSQTKSNSENKKDEIKMSASCNNFESRLKSLGSILSVVELNPVIPSDIGENGFKLPKISVDLERKFMIEKSELLRLLSYSTCLLNVSNYASENFSTENIYHKIFERNEESSDFIAYLIKSKANKLAKLIFEIRRSLLTNVTSADPNIISLLISGPINLKESFFGNISIVKKAISDNPTNILKVKTEKELKSAETKHRQMDTYSWTSRIHGEVHLPGNSLSSTPKYIAKEISMWFCKFSNCGYSSIIRANLLKHVLKHTGEKPFSCHLCGYRSAHAGHVKRHLKAVHASKQDETEMRE